MVHGMATMIDRIMADDLAKINLELNLNSELNPPMRNPYRSTRILLQVKQVNLVRSILGGSVSFWSKLFWWDRFKVLKTLGAEVSGTKKIFSSSSKLSPTSSCPRWPSGRHGKGPSEERLSRTQESYMRLMKFRQKNENEETTFFKIFYLQ